MVQGGNVEPVRPGTDLEEAFEAPTAPASDEGPADADRDPQALARPDTVLSEIAHLLVAEDSPDRVLAAVADALRALVPHDSLSIYEADPALQVLRPVLVRDLYADEIYSMGPRAYGVGLIGVAAKSGEPV